MITFVVMKHWNITITGKVQKVGFRISTKAVANQLGVVGFVRNMPDGSVYIEAEGDTFALESLLEFCHEGPEGSEVVSVLVEESLIIQQFQNFEVLKRNK